MDWRKWLGVRPSARRDGRPDVGVPGLEQLEGTLGHEFHDRLLIRTALTHRSHVHRAGEERVNSNERLEFLGDSVLGLVVNEHLYRAFPDYSEGELTKIKSLVVSRAVLRRAAERVGLGAHLILAPGEIDAGGRKRASILSDAFEAVLGAMYLDGGFAPVAALVERELLRTLDETLADHQLINYKSLLQEKIQARFKTPPRYKVSSTSGPDHAKSFVVEVVVRGQVLGRGEGQSKKLAEQRAARAALDSIGDDPDYGVDAP